MPRPRGSDWDRPMQEGVQSGQGRDSNCLCSPAFQWAESQRPPRTRAARATLSRTGFAGTPLGGDCLLLRPGLAISHPDMPKHNQTHKARIDSVGSRNRTTSLDRTARVRTWVALRLVMPLRGPQLQGLIADVCASVIPPCWSIRVWPTPTEASAKRSGGDLRSGVCAPDGFPICAWARRIEPVMDLGVVLVIELGITMMDAAIFGAHPFTRRHLVKS